MWRMGGERALGNRVEVALAITQARAAKANVVVLEFEPVSGSPVQGTGFTYSPGLAANYVYLPEGPANSLVILPFGFDKPVRSMSLRLLTWPGREVLNAQFCSGVMYSTFSDDGGTAYSAVARWAG